jgi:hypothetical protein
MPHRLCTLGDRLHLDGLLLSLLALGLILVLAA